MYSQDFFVEGRYLGSASREKVFVHNELQTPLSFLLYCDSCGETFARFPCQGPTKQRWFAYARRCRKCGNGSVWIPWEKELIEAFPLPVLQYELERQFELLDKESKS